MKYILTLCVLVVCGGLLAGALSAGSKEVAQGQGCARCNQVCTDKYNSCSEACGPSGGVPKPSPCQQRCDEARGNCSTDCASSCS